MQFEFLLWGIFGLIIGSFVNVLILRYGKRDILGRSACPGCGTTLQWFELVPVLSWMYLRGRCRTCGMRISLQYPSVEILCSAGFLVLGLSPALLVVKIIGAAIIALLVAVSVYDTYHTIIPDQWSYSFGVLALATAALTSLPDWNAFLMHVVAGPLVALPLAAMWFYSRGSWMGLGDAKLALGIGWLLGTLHGFVALMFAFVIGAFVSVFILLPLPHVIRAFKEAGPVRGFANGGTSDDDTTSNGAGITRKATGQSFTMKSEVPFGPFLICALLIVWFSQLYDVELVAHTLDFLCWNCSS